MHGHLQAEKIVKYYNPSKEKWRIKMGTVSKR